MVASHIRPIRRSLRAIAIAALLGSLLGTVGLAILMAPLAHAAAPPAWAWIKSAGGTSYNGDQAHGIALDANGNSYVTGYFVGSATFGSTTLTSAGSSKDVFVAKYDASGNAQWAKSAGGTSTDVGYSIADQ